MNSADSESTPDDLAGLRGPPPPRLRFQLPLDPSRLLRARHRVRDYLHEHGVDPAAIDDVVLAIQEAMTNAVRHSGASEDLTVAVFFEDSDLVAEVVDRGRGFDTSCFDPHFCPSLDGSGGRGLFLMAQLMDELELRTDGGLNVHAVKHGVLGLEQTVLSKRGSGAVPGAQAHRDAREKAMLDEIEEAFFAFDWEYRLIHINQAACRFTGKPVDELLGRTAWELLPSASRALSTAVEQAMQLGTPVVVEYESRFATPGSWLEARVYPTSFGISVFAADISKRKRQELEAEELTKALRESEEQYRAIVETANEGIVVGRPNGRLLYVNRRMAEMLGYPAEDVLGRFGTDFAFSDPAPMVLEVRNDLAQGHTVHREFKFRRRDGSALWTSYNASPMFDEKGEYVANLALHTDITERKEMEAALQKSERRLAEAQHLAHLGSWEWDVATGELACSAELYAIYGLDPKVDTPDMALFARFVHPDDRESVDTAIGGILATGERADFDFRIVAADGSVRVLRAVGEVTKWDDGKPRLVVGTHEDVTERKRAERALEETRFVLAEGERIAHVGTFEYNAETQVTVWSDEECRIYGLAPGTPSPSYQTMLEQFIHPDDAALLDATFRRAMERGSVYELEHRIVRPDGTIRVVHDRASPYFDDAGRLLRYVGATLDITERKLAEEELRQSEERFRMALRNAPVSVAAQDRDLRYVWAYNQRSARPEEIIGRFDSEIFTAGEAERVTAIKRRVLEEDIALREQMWLDRPTGPMFLDFSWEPLHDDAGRVIGVGSATVDLTGMKSVEEALRDSEERFRALFDRMTEGVALHEVVYQDDRPVDYRILRVNPAYERQAGVSEEQAVGALASELYGAAEPPYLKEFSQVAGTGQPLSFDTFFAPLDRHFRVAVVSPAHGQFATIFEDISERKRAEEALREAQCRAQADLEAMTKLQQLAALSIETQDLGEVLAEVVDVAVGISGADFGTLQLLDPTTSDLRIVAQRGFPGWWLDFWNAAGKGKGASGTALELGERVVVDDVAQSPIFRGTPSLEVQLKVGVRAVQATPLVSRSGRQVGMVSTHYKAPHRPDERVLRLLDLLARQAADVVDRAQSEASLRQSNEDLDRAQAVGHIGSWRLDVRENLLTWSDENHRIFGIPPGTPLTYEMFLATVHPEDRTEVDRQWLAGLRGEPYDIEHRLLVEGQVKWVRERAFLEHDENGELLGGYGITQDVTERKLAEEALRESEIRFRSLFESSLDAVFLTIGDGTVLAANPAACSLLGRSEEELRQKGRSIVLDRSDPRLAGALEERRRMGQIHAVELLAMHRNGERFPVEVDSMSLPGEPEHYFVIVRDITERKRAEEELRLTLAERTRLAARYEQQAKRMRVLSEVATTASSALEERQLAQRLVAAVGRLLDVRHVSLASPGADGQIHTVATEGYPEALMSRVESTNLPDDGLLARAHRSGQRILVEGHEANDIGESSKSWAAAVGIGSFAALPLLIGGQSVGVLGLGWPAPRRFSEEEVSLFDAVTAEIAVGLDNARRYGAQQRIATTLQENLVHALPEVEGLEIAVVSQPAYQPELVGGDFYDVFAVGDQVVVLVGDVMGKGIKAAGLTETVRSAARALALVSATPQYILTQLNQLLLKDEHEQFVSAAMLALDPDKGHCSLASAGHPPPIMLSPTGARRIEPRYGVLLGAVEADYTATAFELAPGDTLVLYTDGLTEARRDGELFGEDRLLALVRTGHDLSPDELATHLRDEVLAWAGELKDDLEILVLRRSNQKGTDPEGASPGRTPEERAST